MTLNVFMEYVKIRKELKLHSCFYYFKKTLIAIIFTILVALFQFGCNIEFKYKEIATALVSVNSIVAAFLIVSLTILLTQEVQERIPNTNTSYKKLLINNSEVSAVLVLFSILINIGYLLLSNIDTMSVGLQNWYKNILVVVNYLSIFATVFIINTAIKDLLLISKKTKTLSKDR